MVEIVVAAGANLHWSAGEEAAAAAAAVAATHRVIY